MVSGINNNFIQFFKSTSPRVRRSTKLRRLLFFFQQESCAVAVGLKLALLLSFKADFIHPAISSSWYIKRYPRTDNGQGEQQAETGSHGRSPGADAIHREGAAGLVQGVPQGLPKRQAQRRRVQNDLRQLLSERGPVNIRGTRLSDIRQGRKQHDRVPRVYLRTERDVTSTPGPEAALGLHRVRRGWERVRIPGGNGAYCARYPQDGWRRRQTAERRVDTRETR
ncbi:hypothetical protein EGW08_021212 [Elysia chlorotica]|uniref:Uncharacterized protein n=1 Tax=Elysia chlorotica TaxID=188477 RepID=A0A3S0ZBC4_ELYCH|nr:hypothetical protein EGW08_021212 [Elysia chlorotica]